MRTFISTVLACFYFHISLAQYAKQTTSKPAIDTANILIWPMTPDGPHYMISNNGHYLLHRVWHIPPGEVSMMVRAIGKDWETTLIGAREASFTTDSKSVVFITAHSDLCILTLPDIRREYEKNVNSFKLFRYKDKEMLIYQRTNSERELVLYELTRGIKHVYANIDTYVISKDGQSMLLQTALDSVGHSTLLWVDIGKNEQKIIWKGLNAGSFCFDESGGQLAFLAYDRTTDTNVIWLYKSDQKNAVELLKTRYTDSTGTLKIVGINNFSKEGKKLFLEIRKPPLQHLIVNKSYLNVWSYCDPKLQSMQEKEKERGTPSYIAVLDIQSPIDIWRIQYENESLSSNICDDLIVLTSRQGKYVEKYWNKAASCNTLLAIVNDKKRIPIPLADVSISPNHKYLLGNGRAETWGSDLYVYEIATHTVRNITKNIRVVPRKETSDMVESSSSKGLVLAGWLPMDTGLLIYDDYDIWDIDPTCNRKPIKLTNGREKKIQFRLAVNNFNFFEKLNQPEQPLLLTAFNTKTKQSGFYQLKWNTRQPPKLLFMGDYFFSKIGISDSYSLKARDSNLYLVRRERTDQAPNIFSTEDFQSFSPVTRVYPERSVNWFTSELITFKTTNGIETQAILYKPENFNPANKYPLIIHYYDKKSDDLNRYHPPQGSGTGGELDVAWFTSHGYLVLMTDIHYNIGKTGESVYKAVVSAAEYISKRPYIDKDHIGIQGHSFGGYETNYLITHTNRFAAAVSSAGISEVINFYGSLWPDGSSTQEHFESRNFRIDRTPWQARIIYRANSPLFSVSHVNTPVLLVHNKNDKNACFEQGLGFFTALRRAGKRAWMLQYDNGGHGETGEDYKDYLIKSIQFFNHYLKNSPPPEWMTQGIPAVMKGIKDGFTIDKYIKTPGKGLLINRDTEKEVLRSVPK